MTQLKNIKLYLSYIFLYIIFFAPSINAQEGINFNLGKSIDKNIISSLSNKDSETPTLNLDNDLSEKVIKNIIAVSQTNAINDKNNIKIFPVNENNNTDNIFTVYY